MDTCGCFDFPDSKKKFVPAHPEYKGLGSRIRSFLLAPDKVKIRSIALAESGFFYFGQSDRTVCFQCGIGLKDWEQTDIPWKEHEKYSPFCPFVMKKKGKQYAGFRPSSIHSNYEGNRQALLDF